MSEFKVNLKEGTTSNTLPKGEDRNIRCELVSGEDISYLEGQLKTFLESLGMENGRQEEASKDMCQMLLWDWFNFITRHRTDHLSEKKEWYKENK